VNDLRVALVHEVFVGDGAPDRLVQLLNRAAGLDAGLAVLPELPLDPWPAARREPHDEDAEAPDGPRHRMLAAAARATGVAVLGGAITRDPASGRRFNRALLFDSRGDLVVHYDKLHLPSEPGFWESDHYEPGDELPRRVDLDGFPLGIQICSDANRPQGSALLAAQGTELILVPRATPREGFERWLTVFRAIALTCCVWVVSVNRPRDEPGVSLGSPSVAIAPDGRVVHSGDVELALVTVERSEVTQARSEYPGYLAVRAELYARGWHAACYPERR